MNQLPIVRGLVFALAIMLGGCDDASSNTAAPEAESDVAEAATSEAVMATPSPRPSPKIPIPKQFVGYWKLASIECEADSEEGPPKHLHMANLQILEDGQWWMDIEGFPMRGEVEVHDLRSGPEIRLLPSALDFEIVGQRLENWSEGDAPYMCGRIFERGRN